MNKVCIFDESKNKMQSIVNIYLSLIVTGLPLIVSDGYYNITETKAFYYALVSICFIFFAIIQTLFSKRISRQLSFIDFVFCFYALFNLVSSVLSEYQNDVWLGTESRYQGSLMILLYALVYFVVSRNYKQSQSLLFGILIAFCLVSVIGVLNCFDIDLLGFYNVLAQKYKTTYISTIGNINFYSGYMCLMFPVIVCGFCQTKARLSQTIYITALIVGSFGMMVTSSESFVLGCVFALMIIPLLIFDDTEKLKKFVISIMVIVISSQIYLMIYKSSGENNVAISKLLSLITSPVSSALLMLMCIGGYWLLAKKSQWIKAFKNLYIALLVSGLISLLLCFVLSNTAGIGPLDNIFKINESWGTYRGGIWKQCIEAYGNFSFKEKLFGIGPEALYRVVNALSVHGNKNLDQAHNEYLQILLTTGILGLLSYLSVVISVIYAVCKKLKSNTLAIGLLAGLVAYWIQATVNIAQPFTTPLMYIFISCIGGMLYNESISENPSAKMFNIKQVIKRRNSNGN